MNDYSQPEFYRFNEDSIRLLNWITASGKKFSNILDLGAGCGILGIELANKLHAASVTLLEMQADYRPHLETNLRSQLSSGIESQVIIQTFGRWVPEKKYDLVVCNPPYFHPHHGEVSKDSRKHHARTFAVDGWPQLMETIRSALSPSGSAYLVVRRDKKTLEEIKSYKFKIDEQDHLLILELSGLDKN